VRCKLKSNTHLCESLQVLVLVLVAASFRPPVLHQPDHVKSNTVLWMATATGGVEFSLLLAYVRVVHQEATCFAYVLLCCLVCAQLLHMSAQIIAFPDHVHSQHLL
jgi:hypothetical protein